MRALLIFSLTAPLVALAACHPDPLTPVDDAGAAAPDADAGTLDADAGTVIDDAGSVADAGTSATRDAGVEATDAGTVVDVDGGSCAAPVPGYTCTVGVPDSCPGGECWFGSCVGPQVDDHRYDGCGDGVCGGCDDGPALTDDATSLCPADCAPDPVLPARVVDDDDSLTVFVHGIHIEATATIESTIYGAATDAQGLGTSITALDPTVVDGLATPTAPRQIVGVEFYGTTPDPSLDSEDVAYIEQIPYDTPASIERYARVVERFTKHRFAESGAHSLHLLCHSMGCTVVRFLVEHDLGGLASDGNLTRVVTVSGAVQGAAMANMIDNPVVRQYAGSGLFNIWDIAALDPDHVRDVVAIWNHDLTAADNPTWRGLAIHSIGGSDPTLDEAFNLFSLDAIHNPDELPNDSVVFTLESFFPKERMQNRIISVEGNALLPSHSVLNHSHNAITQDEGAGLVAYAGLFAHTHVVIKLASVTLLNDHEHHSFLDGQSGTAPAEVACESHVSLARPGHTSPLVIDERTVGEHTPEVVVMNAGETSTPGFELYSGPLPDDQGSIDLDLSLVEVDWYKRFGIAEDLLSPTSTLATLTQTIPVQTASYPIASDDASATIEVTVDHVN